jgi:hypothetical protein
MTYLILQHMTIVSHFKLFTAPGMVDLSIKTFTRKYY